MQNSIKITLLEHNTGVYEGSPYANIVARYNGKLLKFKLDVKKVTSDVPSLIDEEVEATYEIVSGSNMSATIKITSLSKKKA